MSKKTHRRKKHNVNYSQFLVGAGVILIGVMLLLLLVFNKKEDASAQASSTTNSNAAGLVNYPAPELSLQNVTGKQESLSDYRDNVVLVNNWATWCPPCKAEIPTLEAYYKAHNADGFVIIGIEAGESQNEVLEFVQSSAITYPIWIDLENASLKAFNSSGLPNSYVIDRKGAVRFAWVGEINRDVLEKYVTPLISEN
jgi:thiol-disulfide isomerase/thioredoxin